MSKAKIEFWDCDDTTDSLTHTDPHDAVLYHLDGIKCEHWPEELEVFGFARQTLQDCDLSATCPIDIVLEWLDPEYGNQNDYDHDEKSEEMKALREAEKTFLATVKKHYEVWTCEIVKGATITVNVLDWVKENAPQWLEDNQQTKREKCKNDRRARRSNLVKHD